MSEVLKEIDTAQEHLKAFLGGFDVADSLYIADRLGKYLEAYQKEVKATLASAFEAGTPIDTSVGIHYKFHYQQRRVYKKSANAYLKPYAEHLLPELNVTETALNTLRKKGVLSQEQLDDLNMNHCEVGEETPVFRGKAIKETE